MDVIDFGAARDEEEGHPVLSVADMMLDVIQRVTEGDLQGVKGAMIVWVNEHGLVEYQLSDNIEVDTALVMCAAVNVDASLRLYGGSDE